MAKLGTNMQEVQKTLSLMKNSGELVEIRMYDGKKIITSGYFKGDYSNLLKGLETAVYENCYFMLNSIKDECYSREQCEKYVKGVKTTTGDKEIENRRWLLIDCDPVRLSGISSTAQEKEYARFTAGKIYNYLRDVGFAYPICADSGNGYHLLYRVDLKNADAVTELVKNFLKYLDLCFSDDKVSVDTSVHNPSRITKLYGTVARKGANTPERPHRLSRILKVPDEIKITDIELIKKVADMWTAITPEKPPKQEHNHNNYGNQFDRFDIHDFMSKYIRVSKTVNASNYTKYLLEECPFDNSHKSPDSMLTVSNNGAIGFKCLHDSWEGKKWEDVRELYEPKQNRQTKYYDNTRTTSAKKFDNSDIPNEKAKTSDIKQYYQLHEIENIDRSQIVSLPSGIKALDRKIVGLNKKEVTVISGNNGSGKSTIIGQLMLTNIEHGFKCTLFSGELSKERVKTWLHLQAAGRQYNKQSQYGANVYFTPKNIGGLIDEWTKGKLFIHNNAAGTNFSDVLRTVTETIEKENTDIVYLDNLMSLDISDVNGDKYEKQTVVIKTLTDIAKTYDIHIVFVCHPRKSTGFLRKCDISGTSDLTNAVDNVLMCHRINQDFIKYSGEFFAKAKISSFLKEDFTNCLEVMKNRDLGVEDELIGLYFEPESKRLLNERFENTIYSWSKPNGEDWIEADDDPNLPPEWK